jgi:plastocyanin
MRWQGILSAIVCAAFAGTSARAQGVSVSIQVIVKPAQHQSSSMKMRSEQVVVWLTPLDSSENMVLPAAPQQRFLLTQKNKQFSPHLLVVPVGASVEFPNLDPFFHNVFSLFNGRRFDLGLYEAGSRRSVRFDHDGVSYIFCNIHPEMGAVIVSLSTPYYTISDRQGSASLDNVPPGEYELNVWSENVLPADLMAAKQRIHVGSQSLHLAPVTLSQTPSSLDGHLNKFGEAYKTPEQNPY